MKIDANAVSPVIGVLLMVAIVVILSAVISALVFGLGAKSHSSPPNAQLMLDDHSDSLSSNPQQGILTIAHQGGDSLVSSNTKILIYNEDDELIDTITYRTYGYTQNEQLFTDANIGGGVYVDANNLGEERTVTRLWINGTYGGVEASRFSWNHVWLSDDGVNFDEVSFQEDDSNSNYSYANLVTLQSGQYLNFSFTVGPAGYGDTMFVYCEYYILESISFRGDYIITDFRDNMVEPGEVIVLKEGTNYQMNSGTLKVKVIDTESNHPILEGQVQVR